MYIDASFKDTKLIIMPTLEGDIATLIAGVIQPSFVITQFGGDGDPVSITKTGPDRNVDILSSGSRVTSRNQVGYDISFTVVAGSSDQVYLTKLREVLMNLPTGYEVLFTITLNKPNGDKEVCTNCIFIDGENTSNSGGQYYASRTWRFQAENSTLFYNENARR